MNEYRGARVALAHLHRREHVAGGLGGHRPDGGTAQPEQQRVMERDRFDRDAVDSADGVDTHLQRHVACNHVRLALIHACMGDVDTQREDVGCLHGRVDQLGEVDVLPLLTAEDADAALHTGERRVLAHLDHRRPVLVVVPVQVRREHERDRIRVRVDAQQRCAERFGEVAGGDPPDQVPVAAELVVDPRVPVGEEDGTVHAGGCEVPDLRHAHQSGAEVRLAGDLEADVMAQLDAGIHQRRQLVHADDLGGVALDERHSFSGGHVR